MYRADVKGSHLDIGNDKGEAQAIDGPEEDGLSQTAGDAEPNCHDAPYQAPHRDHPNAVPIVPCTRSSPFSDLPALLAVCSPGVPSHWICCLWACSRCKAASAVIIAHDTRYPTAVQRAHSFTFDTSPDSILGNFRHRYCRCLVA